MEITREVLTKKTDAELAEMMRTLAEELDRIGQEQTRRIAAASREKPGAKKQPAK